MHDWKDWLREGDQYQYAAKYHPNKTARLDTTFQYNVFSLALESYSMAILDYHKKMPENHTLNDFLEALQTVTQIDPQLKQRIAKHEQIQKLCSWTNHDRKIATIEQVSDFSEAVKQIGALAHRMCTGLSGQDCVFQS